MCEKLLFGCLAGVILCCLVVFVIVVRLRCCVFCFVVWGVFFVGVVWGVLCCW